MESRLAKEWHVVTAPPCEAHRASLDKDGCTRYSTVQKQQGTAENARARTTPVSVSCACRQSGPGLSGPEAGRKQVFSGSDGGLSTGVWTGRFTGFSTTSGRGSGQSVTASDFGSNGPRFESGRGHCVESFDKALYSHCPKEKPLH